MTDDEAIGLLGALGSVEPPSEGTLATAREALWSAIAGEMLPGLSDAAALPEPREAPRPLRQAQPPPGGTEGGQAEALRQARGRASGRQPQARRRHGGAAG